MGRSEAHTSACQPRCREPNPDAILDYGGQRGRLAQGLERLLHTQEVIGSNPLPPTMVNRVQA